MRKNLLGTHINLMYVKEVLQFTSIIQQKITSILLKFIKLYHSLFTFACKEWSSFVFSLKKSIFGSTDVHKRKIQRYN